MEYLMSEAGQFALSEFCGADTLMAFDYDGTLARIEPDRRQAIMRSGTRMALAQLARRRPTVIISGRGRNDVLSLMVGVPVEEVIGNHGLESAGVAASRFVTLVREWHAELDERMEAVPGLEIEDKRYSLSIHFRHCSDKVAAKSSALRVAEHLEGVRIVPGKDVLNVVPAEAPDKGQALLAAMSRHAKSRAIFVGDDDTDEDVFTLPPVAQVLRVRVGFSQTSAAEYFLKDQSEVDTLLGILASEAARG